MRLYEIEQFVRLKPTELPKFKRDIFELIQTAYNAIGGHANLLNPDDIDTSEGKFYEIVDIDDDGTIDAVSVSKHTKYGEKGVAIGHDGTKEAKRAVINFRIKNLKKRGHYVECSGKIYEILSAAGVPVVNNQEDVEEILGKKVDWIGDGWYYRTIGGKYMKKIMMGIPDI